MKAQRFYTVLTIILGVVFAMTLRASNITSNFNNTDALYGNPPNSEVTLSSVEFNFEEEAYINDIPFNTECIAKNCIYRKAVAVSFEFEEEEYVEDIPFDTKVVSASSNFETALQLDFELEDEAYVDDIPFDTYSIANKSVQSHYAYIK